MNDDFKIEIVSAREQLKKIHERPGSGALIPFPLIDEFFEKHWETLVNHDCDNESEFCANALCFEFPGTEVPKKYDMNNPKHRQNLRHLIRNHAQSRITRLGKTEPERINIRFNRVQPKSDEWIVTILRKCTIVEGEKKSEPTDPGHKVFDAATKS